MMTNGTVGTVVAGKKGSRELDVDYSYGKRHITVPANVPVVQIGMGARTMVKVGTPVFMVVQKGPSGMMTGRLSVSVAENVRQAPMSVWASAVTNDAPALSADRRPPRPTPTRSSGPGILMAWLALEAALLRPARERPAGASAS